VFFRAETIGDALSYLRAMFAMNFSSVPFEFLDALNLEVVIALLLGLILSTPVFKVIIGQAKEISSSGEVSQKALSSVSSTTQSMMFVVVFRAALVSVLLFLSAMSLATSTHNPFIYFRF